MKQVPISTPVFFGFGVETFQNTSPDIQHFAVDPTTAAGIRWGDPVKRISSGLIVRATPADTAILGFAASSQAAVTPPSIASLSPPVDANGNPKIPIYLAKKSIWFNGVINGISADAMRYTTFDLMYASLGVQPTSVTVTGGGSADTAYSYTVTAVTIHGESAAGAARATAAGNTTLDGTHFNRVLIPAVSTLVLYLNIYRGNSLIATVVPVSGAATTYDDHGVAATGVAAPTVNKTGWVINDGATAVNLVNITDLDSRDPIGTLHSRCQFQIPTAASQA